MRKTTLSTLLRLALAASLLVPGAARAATAGRQHVVLEIRRLTGASGSPTVTLPNGRPAALTVHQTLPDGARIDVPLRVTVVIASTDAKSTTTLRPDTSFTLVETGAGERSSIAHGGALFSVVHGALDFFQVKYGHAFTASARGTVFSVATTGRRVTFACARGTVDVAYAARLQIGVARRGDKAGGAADKASGPAAAAGAVPVVRAVDVITPAGPGVSFAADAATYTKTFGTASEAETRYDAELAVARASGDPERIGAALNNRGVLYDDSDQHDRAIQLFNEALALNPRDAVTYYNRANSYYGKNDLPRSLADLDTAIRLDPLFADAYSDRGDVYDELGKYDRALADYAVAIRLNPSDADFYYNRAITYSNLRDWDRSIADNTTALRLEPRMADAYFNRALAQRAKGDQDAAIADFTDALRITPTMADAFANRGLAYSGKNDLDRAIADFNEALRLGLASAAVYDNRGLLYSAKDERDRALADYDAAVRAGPAVPFAYVVRGLAYLHSGPSAKAQADFAKAVSLAPAAAYAVLLLEVADRRANAPSRLAETSKPLDQKAWPAPIVRLFRGQSTPAATLAAAHDPNPATERLQVCLANYYVGEYESLQGSKDDAARFFRLAARDCPDLIQREPARAALKARRAWSMRPFVAVLFASALLSESLAPAPIRCGTAGCPRRLCRNHAGFGRRTTPDEVDPSALRGYRASARGCACRLRCGAPSQLSSRLQLGFAGVGKRHRPGTINAMARRWSSTNARPEQLRFRRRDAAVASVDRPSRSRCALRRCESIAHLSADLLEDTLRCR